MLNILSSGASKVFFVYLHCVHAINNDQGAVEPNFGRYLPSAGPLATLEGSFGEKASPLKIWIFDTSPTWRNALFPAAEPKTTIEMMTDDFLCLIRRHGPSFFCPEIEQMELLFWFSLAARASIAAAALFLIARPLGAGSLFLVQGWSNYYFKGTWSPKPSLVLL